MAAVESETEASKGNATVNIDCKANGFIITMERNLWYVCEGLIEAEKPTLNVIGITPRA